MAKFKNRFNIKGNINYFVILLLLIVLVSLTNTGMLSRSMIGLLSRFAYSMILAVSLNLVVGFLGELSLGHAGFMCVGAYIGCTLSNYMVGHISSDLLRLIISLLVGGITAALFGLLIGLPALRLKGDYLAIVTLAFGEIVRNIFKNLSFFGGAKGLSTTKYPSNELFIIAFIVLLLTLFIIQNLIRSKHGRAITAIRDSEIAAKAMGINVTFYKLLVFVVAAFFAGMAGVIYGAYTTPVLPGFFSYNYSIEILVMVVLGGMGNLNGSMISAVLLTYINATLQDSLSGDLAALKYTIYALILIIAVLYNNAEMFSSLREKLSIKNFVRNRKISKGKFDPGKKSDDEARWYRVPTKIEHDELLSTDIVQNDLHKGGN